MSKKSSKKRSKQKELVKKIGLGLTVSISAIGGLFVAYNMLIKSKIKQLENFKPNFKKCDNTTLVVLHKLLDDYKDTEQYPDIINLGLILTDVRPAFLFVVYEPDPILNKKIKNEFLKEIFLQFKNISIYNENQNSGKIICKKGSIVDNLLKIYPYTLSDDLLGKILGFQTKFIGGNTDNKKFESSQYTIHIGNFYGEVGLLKDTLDNVTKKAELLRDNAQKFYKLMGLGHVNLSIENIITYKRLLYELQQHNIDFIIQHKQDYKDILDNYFTMQPLASFDIIDNLDENTQPEILNKLHFLCELATKNFFMSYYVNYNNKNFLSNVKKLNHYDKDFWAYDGILFFDPKRYDLDIEM
jgi:hypothetical protein